MPNDKVRNAVEDSLQPTELTDTIMRVLEENNGKRFDKRIMDKLKAALPPLRYFYVTKSLGWTQLHFGDEWEKTRFITISRQNKNVVIDCDFIRKENLGHFQGKHDNNAEKLAYLATDLPGKLEDEYLAYKAARHQLVAELAKVPDCVRYEVEKALGLDISYEEYEAHNGPRAANHS